MLLFWPARLLKLALIGPRILARLLLGGRFHMLRTALVFLGIAALVSYFARRKGTTPGT